MPVSRPASSSSIGRTPSASRGRELRALTDYTKSVAELQRVMSTTLASNNVEVK
jgi:hypothetical protein